MQVQGRRGYDGSRHGRGSWGGGGNCPTCPPTFCLNGMDMPVPPPLKFCEGRRSCRREESSANPHRIFVTLTDFLGGMAHKRLTGDRPTQ